MRMATKGPVGTWDAIIQEPRPNLRRAILIGANLVRAELAGADLVEANLRDADLSKAVLVGARLEGAVLVAASLDSADLRGSNLTKADLRLTDLRDARMTGANLDGSVFEPEAIPETASVALTRNLQLATYFTNPGPLTQLRATFREGGFRGAEGRVTYAL